MPKDFWAEMADMHVIDTAIDTHLTGKKLGGPGMSALQALTDAGRAANGLRLPLKAGTRVKFIANLGSVLTYADLPGDGMAGTVVTARTSEGHATGDDKRAFILFDDERLRAIQPEHLRMATGEKQAGGFSRTYASLGDLTSFFSVNASRDDELVHKATKDLWSFRRDGGQYVIERLFDENGKPLKD